MKGSINTRQTALEWWKSLDRPKQVKAVTEWQNLLPQHNVAKTWPFEAVTKSSSVIERIWQESIKQQHDINS